MRAIEKSGSELGDYTDAHIAGMGPFVCKVSRCFWCHSDTDRGQVRVDRSGSMDETDSGVDSNTLGTDSSQSVREHRHRTRVADAIGGDGNRQ